MRLKFDIDPSVRSDVNEVLDFLDYIASRLNGQPPARSTADAAPLQTARAATPEATSVQAQTAFGPNAAPPAPTATPAVLPLTAPARDAEGLPYDPRIHSANSTLTDKGIWRTKRGVSGAEIKRVEAELRAAQAAPAAVVAVAPAPPLSIDPNVPPAPVAPPAPTPPVEPPAAPPPAAPIAAGDLSFTDFLQMVGKASMIDQPGTQAKVNGALMSVQLQNMQQLVTRPDLVPTVARLAGFIQ